MKDHLVVLGWDDGVFAELQEAARRTNGCYVLTNQDAFTLQRRLRRAGLKDVFVYAGEYDDPSEWGSLNLELAKKVFVSGEGNEEAHDARVLMVSKVLERVFPKLKFPDFKQVVNVRDFGLANKLQSTSQVKFENFHLKWSRHLISELSFEHGEGGLNMLVVGSGAMGQAVVWAAFKKYGKSLNVVFSDDDEEKRLKEQPRFLEQTWGGQPEFCDWKEAKKRVDDFYAEAMRSEGAPLVVVVAKKRSEKGWTSLVDLQQRLGNCCSKKIVFALSQEIGGWVVGLNDGKLRFDDGQIIRLFGFKRGVSMSDGLSAASCRNPHTGELVRYAAERGDELVRLCGIDGARWVLGGSLAYDAALVGCYDIDLRLLLPESPDVRDRINAVKDLLVRRAEGDPTFQTKFIDEGGKNYIWHTKRMIKVPGLSENADVELSWNIQSEKSYRSIAEMAARFPREVIDRYVVAKWNARMKGGSDYKTLKEKWKKLVNWAIDRNVHELSLKGRELSDDQLAAILKSVAEDFPEFLG